MGTINFNTLSTSFLKDLLELDLEEVREELKKRELVKFPYKKGDYLLSMDEDNIRFIKVVNVGCFVVIHDSIENDPKYNSIDEYKDVEYNFDNFLNEYQNIVKISEEDYNKAKALIVAYNNANDAIDAEYSKRFGKLSEDVMFNNTSPLYQGIL